MIKVNQQDDYNPANKDEIDQFFRQYEKNRQETYMNQFQKFILNKN